MKINNDLVSIVGSNGFIGSNFLKLYPADSLYISSDVDYPQSNIILYLRSTTNNYNNPELDIEVNLVKLVKFLKHLNSNHRFIFVSSWFVYSGDNKGADKYINENDLGRPLGYYSATKACAEQLVETYCKLNNIPYLILRLSNIVGPGDNFSAQKNALQYLINKLRNNETVELYDQGDFYRSFLHVDDCCAAIKFLMNIPEVFSIYNIERVVSSGLWNQIYNIGPAETTWKFNQIINYCKNKLGSSSIIESRDPSSLHKIVQVKNFRIDTTKLRTLGFKYKFPKIEEVLDTLLN